MEKNQLGARIFTNSKCIGCNNCISACSLARSVVRKDRIVEVDAETCSKCCCCLEACPHDALYYTDDTSSFLKDLRCGEEIVLAVDPAFFVSHQKDAAVFLGYLKKIGVAAVYDSSLGNEIFLWATLRWLEKNSGRPAIVSHCFTTLECMENYAPSLLPFVSPAMTGALSLAQYLRKYKNETRKIAYLSPCVASKDFICHESLKNLVNYNVTFKYLLRAIGEEVAASRDSITPAEPEMSGTAAGALLPFANSLKDILGRLVGSSRSVIDFPNLIDSAQEIKKSFLTSAEAGKNFVLVSESCARGCAAGTGVDRKALFDSALFAAYDEKAKRLADKSEFSLSYLDKKFEGLELDDFYMKYVDRYDEREVIPESVLQEIFRAMDKNTEQTQNIDCKFCGYKSCREMAQHIAVGDNNVANCIFYQKKSYKKFLTTDSTTGLQNARAFFEHLERLISAKELEGYSAVQLHIMDLILVNELYGFSAGSKLLFEFSQRSLAVLQGRGDIFHGNGPTFFAIVKNESVNNFIFRVNHFEFDLGTGKNGGAAYTVSVNCGVYRLEGTEKDAGEVFNPLSAAYSNAKNSRNGSVVFYDGAMKNSMLRSISLSQQLPVAFRNKEFSIVLQPKVSAKDRRLVGAEALIRWSHNGKIIPPATFIAIAENTGLIKQIDFFMLTEVCKYLATWQEIGAENVRVSVNFSKENFLRQGFAGRVCGIVDSYKVPHECVEIEITESSFADDLDSLQREIRLLHDQDIHVSVDDFGTGYSSISLLQNLEFDVIKFDKTLIDTIVAGTRAEIVMKNMVNMAKALNMSVVAEGVDTQERLDLLSSLGCDLIQGYIFDKPLQPPDFLKRLLRKQYSLA